MEWRSKRGTTCLVEGEHLGVDRFHGQVGAGARRPSDLETKASVPGVEITEVFDELEGHLIADDRVDESVTEEVANAEEVLQPCHPRAPLSEVLPAK